MKFGMFYPVAVASEAELGTGLWGLDRGRYASTIEDLREQAICADETGWTSMMFAEHHFEIEGYQANVAIDAARFNRPAPPKPY